MRDANIVKKNVPNRRLHSKIDKLCITNTHMPNKPGISLLHIYGAISAFHPAPEAQMWLMRGYFNGPGCTKTKNFVQPLFF